ncbi:MAG TPA: cytochrome P450 [Streptosporangiaceae bacterium]|nr:cytochrome P450 [Streptosporangiaceae bacterium]
MTDAAEAATIEQPRNFPFGGVTGIAVDPLYTWLREHEPVSRIRLAFGADAWLVTRHEDVRTVLTSPSFSRAMAAGRDVPRAVAEDFNGGLVGMDPPQHTALRSLVSAPFTRAAAVGLRARVEEIVGELIAGMAGRSGPVDLAESFAVPLTLTLICEVLGVPHADRAQFREWTEAGMADEADKDSAVKLWQYHIDLIAERHKNPTEDLLSYVAAEGQRCGYDQTELAMLAMTVLIAGYLTASTQLPTMFYILLKNPSLHRQILDSPAIIPTAVDELVRWIPLEVHGAPPRYAAEDIVLSGTRIRAGEPVIGFTTAANRDPRVFADPETIDLTRNPNPHLSFGAGAHYCLGVALAKTELEAGLSALCAAFPDMRLAVAEEDIRWKNNPLVRGVEKLPVTWGARS